MTAGNMAAPYVRIKQLETGTSPSLERSFDYGKDIEAFLDGAGNIGLAHNLPEDVTRIARICMSSYLLSFFFLINDLLAAASYFDGLAIEPFIFHIKVTPRNVIKSDIGSHIFELPVSTNEPVRHIVVLRPDDRVSVRLDDGTVQNLDFDISHEEVQVKSSNRPRVFAAQSTPVLAMTASDLVVKDTPTVDRILKRTETSFSVPLDAGQESALPEIAESSPMRDNSANDRMDMDEQASDTGGATPKAAASDQTKCNGLAARERPRRMAEPLMSSADAADDVYSTPMDVPAINGVDGEDETESESEKEPDTEPIPEQAMSLGQDESGTPPLMYTKKQSVNRSKAKGKYKAEASLSKSTSKKRTASAQPDEITPSEPKPKRSRHAKVTNESQDSRDDTIAVQPPRAASRARPKPKVSSPVVESEEDIVTPKPGMPLTPAVPGSIMPRANRKKSQVSVVIEKATSNISERSTPSESTSTDKLANHDVAKPVIAFSGSPMSTMSEVNKFLRSQGASVVDNVTSETTLLVVGKGELKKTSKVLMCMALGIPLATDKWVTASRKAKRLLGPSDFLPEDTTNGMIGKGRQDLLEGYSIYLTPALKRDYGTSGYNEIKAIAKAAGAKDVISKVSRSIVNDDGLIILGLSHEDIDAKALHEKNLPLFTKELLSTSIIRGKLETDSSEFQITFDLDQPKKTPKKGGRKVG